MIEAVFSAAAPLILAGLGGLISERAGVLNISLEGCIGAGAFTAALLSISGVPDGAAVLGAGAAGVVFGGILGGAHLGLGANLFIAGLGINRLIPSLIGLVSQSLYGHKGIIRVEPARAAWVSWAMFPLAAAVVALLKHTRTGRRIRAVGEGIGFVEERGLSAKAIRLTALVASSAAAALSGATMSLRIGAFVPGMSSGKGWIALVLIWMGFRRPAGILASGYIFTLFEIASGRIQGVVAGPASLMLGLPYAAALLALVVASITRRK